MIHIEGGHQLEGEVRISGAKNSALPILVSTLLTDKPVTLYNIPDVLDVRRMINILNNMGKHARPIKDGLSITNSSSKPSVPEVEIGRMRASILLLAPMLVRHGKANLPFPGGCNIGRRGIDFHLTGLERLGAKIHVSDRIEANADSFQSADIDLQFPSVGATESMLMATAFLEGESTISNIALEPEVVDLITFLNNMGADIDVEGRNAHVGEGSAVETTHTIIPDRIETGTYLTISKMFDGKILLNNPSTDLPEFNRTLKKLDDGEFIKIETGPFPSFPTDLQPIITPLLSQHEHDSTIVETIFDNRFRHLEELAKMGISHHIKDNQATIHGNVHLKGANVTATDIRGGMAMLIAALASEGNSTISREEHILRGYENPIGKIQSLGGVIR